MGIFIMITQKLKCLAGLIFLTGNLWATDIAIVASQEFPAQTLTRDDVRDIFLGERTMVSGVKIRTLDFHDPSGIRRIFLKTLLNISEDGFESYWIMKIFQDGGTPPIIINTLDEVALMLIADKSTISFMSPADARSHPELSVLLLLEMEK